jgi:hypothetical protein
MALKNGYSRKTFDENYAQMKRERYTHDQALAAAYRVARASFFARFPDGALPEWLTPKDGKRMKNPCEPCRHRTSNPVPASRRVQIRDAAKLYSDFTGHKANESVTIDKPIIPDVALVVGDIDGVMYTTVRDGKTEKYIHEFKKKCRPLFCVSHDGKQIFMLGGSYDFTERGIVDKT